MNKAWLALVSLVCAAALALPLFATASHMDVRDRNDTRGKLDVRRVLVDFTKRPRWTITTWGTWTVERLWDRGYALVQLDTFGTERFDYYAFVRSDGYKLIGTLVRDRSSKPDFTVSSIRAFKSSGTSLSLRFPLKKMRIGNRRLFYRWQVQTIFTAGRCPTSCFDFAPNTGAVSEPVPGVQEPTPTPTVTVTPTPDPTATATPTPEPTESP